METETNQNQEQQMDTGSNHVDQSDTNQATSKNFTQEEVNRIVAERVERERKKFDKQYGNIDLDHYNELSRAEEERKLKRQKERGEFEAILKDTVSKKDATIGELQQELTRIKVDGALLNAASTSKAVNPEQVVSLLKGQTRLGEDGSVEIIDLKSGQVRYTDEGNLMTINDLVGSFLRDNPHFLAASPAGNGVSSNTGISNAKVGGFDVTALDLTKASDREKYREAKAKGLL